MVTSGDSNESQTFNFEQLSQLSDRKVAIEEDHKKYIEGHPEIQQLLSDFMSSVLVDKPEDPFEYAYDYFDNMMPSRNPPRLRPIVVAGPSGVGKGTIIELIMKEFPDLFGFSVSHTTRDPRPGEVDGTHYHFTNVDQIQSDIQEGRFIEHAEVHGNYYGTSVEAVEAVADKNKICVLDIDIQGVLQVKKSQLKPHYIFITPPSIDTLEQRLRSRGTETEESIERRLGNAKGEIEYSLRDGFFDLVITNDNLDRAHKEFRNFLYTEYAHIIK
eukprot:GFYU01019307.1.p1 GENE.GFYU01019307.1~~GFYU01019307.1.p1  ORF type:complete len:272 (+),score=78.17 GFYU01019307.1:18-833(+)